MSIHHWLVLWTIFHFSIYWEFHNPNWRTHIFKRGGSTTNQIIIHPFFLLNILTQIEIWFRYDQVSAWCKSRQQQIPAASREVWPVICPMWMHTWLMWRKRVAGITFIVLTCNMPTVFPWKVGVGWGWMGLDGVGWGWMGLGSWKLSTKWWTMMKDGVEAARKWIEKATNTYKNMIDDQSFEVVFNLNQCGSNMLEAKKHQQNEVKWIYINGQKKCLVPPPFQASWAPRRGTCVNGASLGMRRCGFQTCRRARNIWTQSTEKILAENFFDEIEFFSGFKLLVFKLMFQFFWWAVLFSSKMVSVVSGDIRCIRPGGNHPLNSRRCKRNDSLAKRPAPWFF